MDWHSSTPSYSRSRLSDSCPDTEVHAASSSSVSSALVKHLPYTFPSLIDPRFDSDSCGVGFVAQLSGEPAHAILQHALTALARLEHRGAVAADGKSSDGVGIMTSIPRDFLLASVGLTLDPMKPLGVLVAFLPEPDTSLRELL